MSWEIARDGRNAEEEKEGKKKRRSEEEKHTLRELRLSDRLGSGSGQKQKQRTPSVALGFSGKLKN